MAAAAEISHQTEIPGTEKGTEQLRADHVEYLVAKYAAKAAQDRTKVYKQKVLDGMEREGLEDISGVIVVDGKNRRGITRRTVTYGLESELGDEILDPDQPIPFAPTGKAQNDGEAAEGDWHNEDDD